MKTSLLISSLEMSVSITHHAEVAEDDSLAKECSSVCSLYCLLWLSLLALNLKKG